MGEGEGEYLRDGEGRREVRTLGMPIVLPF